MPVSPTEWLNFATALLGDDEIANRSAASRAYYAAFHASKPLADQLPNTIHSDGMHDRAIRAMKECPATTANRSHVLAIHRVGILLGQCRSIRTIADYRCGIDFSKAEAQEAIGLANQTMASLQTIKYP